MTYATNRTGRLGSFAKPANFTLLAVSALALGLAGCGARHGVHEPVASMQPMLSPDEAHPISVEKAHTTMSLVAPAAAHGLNAYQKEKVRHFIADWRSKGTGKISVAGNNRAALSNVRDLLIAHNVPVGAVTVGGFDGASSGVKLSYARWIAQGPSCGHWHENLSENKDNANYGNFGCAAQQNLAAMIDNPKDLVTPRDTVDWSDGDRRDFMFRHWWKGDKTQGDTNAVEDKGSVSKVASN